MYTHKILFVDSNAAFNHLVENIIDLDNLPVKARFESSSIKALAYLRKCTEAQFPDVIICEARLPFCRGFEFLNRCIQEFYDDYPETLFFVTSLSPSKEDMAKIKQHPVIRGMLPKPFSKEIFTCQVLTAISGNEVMVV